MESSKIDKAGKYVILQFNYHEQCFILAVVHAPNKDDPKFYMQLIKHLDDFEGKRILCGDFNLVLDIEKDRFSKKGVITNNRISSETLKMYMENSLRCLAGITPQAQTIHISSIHWSGNE